MPLSGWFLVSVATAAIVTKYQGNSSPLKRGRRGRGEARMFRLGNLDNLDTAEARRKGEIFFVVFDPKTFRLTNRDRGACRMQSQGA